ncbi:MAG: flagellar biosynthetic protein FliQ [Planctomycetota bacterium]
MDPQISIDLSREAIRTCLMVGGPILIIVLVIGLLISVVQAMTQLHDQTIAFVPKILLLLIALAVGLPWLSDQMIDFAKTSFEKPMWHDEYSVVQPTPSKPEVVSKDRVATLPASSFISRKQALSDQYPSKVPALASQDTDEPHSDSFDGEREQENIQPRTESPFMLPHYRYERRDDSDSNLEGSF